MDTIDGEEKIFFAAFADEQYLGVLELPYALYQSCLITGEPIWDYPVNECGAVDQQWIMDRLQSGVTRDAEPECEHFGKVPSNSLSLTVLIGCQPHGLCGTCQAR